MNVEPGLYTIHWKNSGGTSLGAVGRLHDGTCWYAPCNWTSEQPTGVASTNWDLVSSVSRDYLHPSRQQVIPPLEATPSFRSIPSRPPPQAHSLGGRLPWAMAHLACEIMPIYAMTPEGAPALELMKAALRRAAEATARQDVVAMLHACIELEGFEL